MNHDLTPTTMTSTPDSPGAARPAAAPALQPLPLRLPRLTRNEAQARSVLAQRAQGCEVWLGHDAVIDGNHDIHGPDSDDTSLWHLSVSPLRSGSTPAMVPGCWRIKAEWAGAPFELDLPGSACELWLAARFPPLDVPSLTPAMRAAFTEALLEQALQALRAIERGPARIESIDDAPQSVSTLPQRFEFVLHNGTQPLRGRLSTTSLGLMLMAGLAAQREPAAGPLAAERLAVTLRAEIGTTRMPATTLKSLATGDAILMDHSWATQDGELWLGAGHWGLRVREEGSSLVITQPFHYTESIMNTDNDSETGEEGLAALDDLPVRLSFDLGERTLTLGEVTTLQVGQVLELATPLSQAVNIRANGALVGLGELLEIGGRIAVGITSLGRPREAAAPAALDEEEEESIG